MLLSRLHGVSYIQILSVRCDITVPVIFNFTLCILKIKQFDYAKSVAIVRFDSTQSESLQCCSDLDTIWIHGFR